jgi:steroid delta-isomerase-like uncharacterized protein
LSIAESVERYWAAYNAHDLKAVLALLAKDVEVRFPTAPQPIVGRQVIGTVWEALFASVIPDIHEDIQTVAIDGNVAACEVVESGTVHLPQGLASGASATGRSYRMNLAAFFHFGSDGLMTQVRSYWDTGTFCEQLGIDLAVLRAAQAAARAGEI